MAPQKSKVIPVEVFGRRVEDQLELRTRNFAGTRSRYLFSLVPQMFIIPYKRSVDLRGMQVAGAIMSLEENCGEDKGSWVRLLLCEPEGPFSYF